MGEGWLAGEVKVDAGARLVDVGEHHEGGRRHELLHAQPGVRDTEAVDAREYDEGPPPRGDLPCVSDSAINSAIN